MADINVNKKLWDAFSKKEKAAAEKALKEQGIIGEDSSIKGIEDPNNTLGQQDTRGDFEDIVDACAAASRATYIACMATPGTNEKLCSKASTMAFYGCMEGYQKK